MSPRPGTKVSLVAPASPTEAKEAVEAVAGKVEESTKDQGTKETSATNSVQVGAATGGEGAAKETPPERHEPDKDKKGWIEIELKDEEGTPQGGARYRILLPDGTIADGTLDDKGRARVEGFDPGQCKIEFPELDEKLAKAK